MTEPNNPPLFHYNAETADDYTNLGTEVTLRDLLAAFAIAGLSTGWTVETAKNLSETAYMLADAMLEVRSR